MLAANDSIKSLYSFVLNFWAELYNKENDFSSIKVMADY